MSEQKKTRGVFAIISVRGHRSGGVLISERQDGKGWNLPGGGTDGEDDIVALVREVREETGLEVEVIEKLGPDHVFKDDTAVAYICRIVGDGEPVPTAEAKRHAYVSKEDLIGAIEGKTPYKLVGPEGRLGRTGRMVFDGLSILEEPERGPNGVPEEMVPVEGIFVSDDGLYLIDEAKGEQRKWRRLDPYTPSGYMEPAAAPAS